MSAGGLQMGACGLHSVEGGGAGAQKLAKPRQSGRSHTYLPMKCTKMENKAEKGRKTCLLPEILEENW
jgi:hypothetical protein